MLILTIIASVSMEFRVFIIVLFKLNASFLIHIMKSIKTGIKTTFIDCQREGANVSTLNYLTFLMEYEVLKSMIISLWKNYKPLRICIEGNIAAGKSTLLKALIYILPSWIIIVEPVPEWEPFLDLVKDNPKSGYEFLLQMVISDSFVKSYKRFKWNPDNGIIERSHFSNIYVFSKLYFNAGIIKEEHFNYMINKFEKEWIPTFDAVMFVYTPAALCLERAKERKRGCETGLTLDYLETIEQCYTELKERLKANGKLVFEIDGTQTKEAVLTRGLEIIRKLLRREYWVKILVIKKCNILLKR